MREIIFRGYSEEYGWIYGDVAAPHKNYPANIFPREESVNFDAYEGISVNPETVGQYTGMMDRDGEKIFEGDIVDLFGMHGEIIQKCGAFGVFVDAGIDYDVLEGQYPFCDNLSCLCEAPSFISLWELWWNYQQADIPIYFVDVIGNKWDNPELLEYDGGLKGESKAAENVAEKGEAVAGKENEH